MEAVMASAFELAGHRESVNCLDVHADDPSRLLSGADDGTLRLWDIKLQRSSRALITPDKEPLSAVCLGGKGASSHVAFGAAGRCVYLFDLRAPGVVLRDTVHRATANQDEVRAPSNC